MGYLCSIVPLVEKDHLAENWEKTTAQEGLIFGGAYLRREICCASLIVGGKFTVFALFYFVFEGNFPSTSPWGAYIWRGLLSEFYGRPFA